MTFKILYMFLTFFFFWIDYLYLVFTIVYVVECIIKLLGLGWKKVGYNFFLLVEHQADF